MPRFQLVIRSNSVYTTHIFLLHFHRRGCTVLHVETVRNIAVQIGSLGWAAGFWHYFGGKEDEDGMNISGLDLVFDYDR